MLDDETFFAWLDGELAPAEAERVSAVIAASPALTAKAREHRELGLKLKTAFAPIASEALPETLLPPRPAPAKVLDFTAAASNRAARRGAWQWPQLAAMAASLAIGVVSGSLLLDSSQSPVDVQSGVLVASGTLDRALDTQLASADQSKAAVRIGLTFKQQDGQICRSFTTVSSSGLACRDVGRWQVQGLFAADPQSGDYRMAAGADPALSALIDARLAGEPFDAASERKALAQGWR
jgi:hypothetical protein